jgi:hypothetical protein
MLQAFVKKLEGHATIKLSADVLASLRTISPETYTGIFTPGAELEVKKKNAIYVSSYTRLLYFCYILVCICLLELSRLRPAGIRTPGAAFDGNTKYCCMCVLSSS